MLEGKCHDHIEKENNLSEITSVRDFSGGPVAKTSPFNVGGVGLTPGQGAKIPHVSRPKTKT